MTMGLPAGHRAVLRARDSHEPVKTSAIIAATDLPMHRVSQIMQDLTRDGRARTVPPGTQWELTDTGRATLAAPQTIPDGGGDQAGGARP
jgi:hypothetical protein